MKIGILFLVCTVIGACYSLRTDFLSCSNDSDAQAKCDSVRTGFLGRCKLVTVGSSIAKKVACEENVSCKEGDTNLPQQECDRIGSQLSGRCDYDAKYQYGWIVTCYPYVIIP